MENASKALLIAGGILIAVLTISLLTILGKNLNTIGEEEENKKLSEQVTAFNQQYEAFNKSRMYGADVISVVNKAIDYNGGLEADEHMYFINIILTINNGRLRWIFCQQTYYR